jgi:hypothetical protein
MTSGYDPMKELDGLAERLDSPPSPPKTVTDRRLGVAPPPRSDLTAPIPRPAPVVPAPTDDHSGPGRTSPSAPKSDQPDKQPASPARSTTATESPAPGPTTRGSRNRQWEPAEATKSINGYVPSELVRRLTAWRLDREAIGDRVVVATVFNEAVAALPPNATKIGALLDVHADQLNIGKRRTDANWLPETSFGTRLRVSTDRHLAGIIRDFHAQHGVKLAREDLYALALAIRLDEAGA